MANPSAPLLHGQTVLREGAQGDFIFHGHPRKEGGEFDTGTALISRAGESKIESVPAGTLKAKPLVAAPPAVSTPAPTARPFVTAKGH